MRLSRASRYALHALACIAKDGDGKLTPTPALSTVTGIPAVYLLKSLKPLVGKRILDSTTGPNGGYRLVADANKVTVLDVIEAVDGPLAAQVQDMDSGDEGVERALDGLVENAVKGVRGVYAGTTLAQLARRRK